MHRRMRHLEREGEYGVSISTSANFYSFYLTLKTAQSRVIEVLKVMRMKRTQTIHKKKKGNCLEMFDKRNEPKFPMRSHCCRFCDGRK